MASSVQFDLSLQPKGAPKLDRRCPYCRTPGRFVVEGFGLFDGFDIFEHEKPRAACPVITWSRRSRAKGTRA